MSQQGPISVAVYGRTDVGLIREHNEDNFLIADLGRDLRTNEVSDPLALELHEKGALLIVCDGMGGAAAGEVASQMAVDAISSAMAALQPPDRDAFGRGLRRAIEDANDKIYAQSRDNQSERGMGTTCTAAALRDAVLVVGQIGDSRCYVLRDGRLGQVTKDQSLAWQLIEAGAMTPEEAKHFEHGNIILQALGVQERVDVILSKVPLFRGDVVLLSSDGLHGPVSDEEITEILKNEPDLKKAGDQLIARALEHEGPDNVTIVLARFDGEGLALPTAQDRVEFIGYDPGRDAADGRVTTRTEPAEKETQEVTIPRDFVASVTNGSESPAVTESPAPSPTGRQDNAPVVAFIVLTLIAAVAAGLFLRWDRNRALQEQHHEGSVLGATPATAAAPSTKAETSAGVALPAAGKAAPEAPESAQPTRLGAVP